MEQTERDKPHCVKTYFHPDDYERIIERAQREGRPVANWLRQVALVAVSSPYVPNPGLAEDDGLGTGVLGAPGAPGAVR